MIQSPHTLSYCALCETEMIRCAVCGNNCCNGGSGTVDGEKCKTCLEAYDHQDMYKQDKASVVFAKDLREEHKAAGKKALDEMGYKRIGLKELQEMGFFTDVDPEHLPCAGCGQLDGGCICGFEEDKKKTCRAVVGPGRKPVVRLKPVRQPTGPVLGRDGLVDLALLITRLRLGSIPSLPTMFGP